MDGVWIPDDLLYLKPLWRNLFENPSLVQFCHRILATTTWLTALILAFASIFLRLQPLTRKALYGVGSLAMLQFGLGITVLLLQVPVVLGVLHQAVAVILFASVLWLRLVITFG